MPICPKCNNSIIHTNFKGLETKERFGGKSWKALAHCCPSFDATLSVEIDPIAVKNDILDGVKKLLMKRY